MRLKSLKVVGFKSFVDSTTVHFPSSRSAIVGPNGCGKSNVIDAIRWVMGESSAKQLRGDAMSDVIFAGTTLRKPVSVASVELNFENTEGKLGGTYKQYSELSVKRQVSRDGKSNYFINGSKCRRRDITDIFLGTGLGPRSYAVIEQGMVTRLVEAKPDDLRVFIEEAAGVSRYQARRKETLQHLEHTKQNLERLVDVQTELDAQIKVLRRQASGAIKFKEYQAEHKNTQIALWSFQYQTAELLLNNQQRHLDELNQQYLSVLDQRNAQQQAEEDCTEALNSLLATTEPLQNQWQQAERALTELQTSSHLMQQQKDELTHLQQQLQHKQQQLQDQLDELNHTLYAQDTQLEDSENDLDSLQSTQAQLETAQQQQLGQIHSAQQTVQQTQNQYQQLNQQQRDIQAQINALQTSIGRNTSQTQQLQQFSSDLGNIAQLAQEQAELNQALDHSTQQLSLAQQQQHSLQTQLSDSQAQLTLSEQQLKTIQLQQATAQAELNAQTLQLQKLEQKLLARAQTSHSATAEPQDTLYKLFTLTELGNTHASHVAAILQKWLSFSVAANQSLPALTAHGMPLQQLWLSEPAQLAKQDLSPWQNSQTLVPFASLIATPSLKLFEHWYLVDNLSDSSALQQALALVNNCNSAVLFDQQGMVVSYSYCGAIDNVWNTQSDPTANNALIELPPLISQLTAQLQTLNTQLQQQDLHVQQLKQQWLQAQSALADNNQHRQAMQIDQQQTQLRISHITQSHKSALTQQAQQQQQLQQLQQLLTEDQSNLDELQLDLAALEMQLDELEPIKEQQQSELHQLTTEQARATGAYNDSKIQLARAQQQHANLLAQQRTLQQQQIKWQTELQLAHTQLEQTNQKLTQLSQQQPDSTELLTKLQDEVELAKTNWQRQQGKLQQLQQQQQHSSQLRLTLQQQETELRNNLENLRLNWQTHQLKMQQANQQLSDIGASVQLSMVALDNLSLSEINQQENSFTEKLHELSHKMQRLGELNLAAPQALAELSDRYNELDLQMADLNSAIEQLEAAMHSIDHETRTLFMETFNKVNTQLQTLFPKVFGGGQASLSLEDGWQSGVRLMAQPPGKRNSSITLLSGGEKTLTALALVFAIFSLNPAPFCVLDEVDAPLDDANVERYCSLVKSLSDQVQFIYITHNKVAMGMADTLLGVTMPEAGVSKVVSVSIDEAASYSE